MLGTLWFKPHCHSREAARVGVKHKIECSLQGEEWQEKKTIRKNESRWARVKNAEIVKTLVLTPRASKEPVQFTQGPSPCGNFKNGMGKLHCAARKLSYSKTGERNPCAEGLGWRACQKLAFQIRIPDLDGPLGFFLIQQFNSATDKSQRAKEKVFLNKSWARRKHWILPMTKRTERRIQRKLKDFL